ncbi:MAG: hypothetical protein SGPRY_013689 [Prymnesium sp.]
MEKAQQTAEAEEEEAEAMGREGGLAEASSAGRRNIDSVKGAERLLEAMKVLEEDEERSREYHLACEQWEQRAAAAARVGEAPPKRPQLVPNMMLLNMQPGPYLLHALSSVRAAELEQALLLLPFDAVEKLLTRLQALIDTAPQIELMARCVLFLLKVHHKTVVAHGSMIELLHRLDSSLRARLEREQSVIGYNMAAMRHIRAALELKGATPFFEEVLAKRQEEAGESTAELRRKTVARKQRKKR